MDKLNKSDLLLLIISLCLLTLNIVVYTNKVLTPTYNNNQIIAQYKANKQKEETEVEEVTEEVELTDKQKLIELKSMIETDRIHKYFAEYISCIDLNQYEEAYEHLYDEFKTQYFPTLNDFKEYADSTYPQFMEISYEDIDRQGTYYILTVKVYNAVSSENDIIIEQKFIIYELDFGEYVLSFQL